ncbi:UbiD family decarboxylase [Nocardia terpenica]|uniref:UbiD family decarboxylase n=1 Tax=Nocardia terpenica TaxID=455432 RepID=UPI00189609C2|nr:UbiD family decarboxylase [Nocardia terpenica]MBF6065368.1 UbiD family decarboxylase [Nocardia terpenica]MBF6108940.1 UbiD family decarboxylase [Nocardia terpenica]MBF6121783.1 UbiD family decarboxylase [Nocardia terpenica]
MFCDLREYFDELRELGDLRAVTAPVSPRLEAGAIARLTSERGGPVLVLEDVAGYPGWRLAAGMGGLSTVADAPYARAALSLGMRAATPGPEIVRTLSAAQQAAPIEPTVVASGVCQRHVLTGDDIDLYKLPIPLIHNEDGGPYVNTWGTFVVRTPDRGWTNWSISRAMLTGPNTFLTFLTTIANPPGTDDPYLQHLGEIADRGRSGRVEFALVQGGPPALPFVSAMGLPPGVSEAGYLGGLQGRPVPLVRCVTVDLEVPATAEVVIEGYLDYDAYGWEGPFVEYNGFGWREPLPVPTCVVTAVTHRDDPIYPFVSSGKPVDESQSAVAVMWSAAVLTKLRDAGLPVSGFWYSPESALHIAVVTVDRGWEHYWDSSARLCEIIARVLSPMKLMQWATHVIVAEDDINPSDPRDVLWAFSRIHPTRDRTEFPTKTLPLQLFLEHASNDQETDERFVAGPTLMWNALLGTEKRAELIPGTFAANYPGPIRDRARKLVAGLDR